MEANDSGLTFATFFDMYSKQGHLQITLHFCPKGSKNNLPLSKAQMGHVIPMFLSLRSRSVIGHLRGTSTDKQPWHTTFLNKVSGLSKHMEFTPHSSQK